MIKKDGKGIEKDFSNGSYVNVSFDNGKTWEIHWISTKNERFIYLYKENNNKKDEKSEFNQLPIITLNVYYLKIEVENRKEDNIDKIHVYGTECVSGIDFIMYSYDSVQFSNVLRAININKKKWIENTEKNEQYMAVIKPDILLSINQDWKLYKDKMIIDKVSKTNKYKYNDIEILRPALFDYKKIKKMAFFFKANDMNEIFYEVVQEQSQYEEFLDLFYCYYYLATKK